MTFVQQPSTPSESLPSRAALTRATVAALVVAALLAVGVVLPAETGRDPLGLGAVLGLTEMGRIKVALAQDTATGLARPSLPAAAGGKASAVVIDTTGIAWRDTVSVTLQPNKGVELKLDMQKDDTAFYSWSADSGEVYFNRHGEPPNAPKDFAAHSYAKGMAREDQGEIVAVFDGVHGWFWRNRSGSAVTISLKTRGQYRSLKRM